MLNDSRFRLRIACRILPEAVWAGKMGAFYWLMNALTQANVSLLRKDQLRKDRLRKDQLRKDRLRKDRLHKDRLLQWQDRHQHRHQWGRNQLLALS